jgi:superfamily II DNA or RNA helicase
LKNFITNSEKKKLKDRLTQLIVYSKELKFLVGFFYFSGITELYNSLKNNNTAIVKILVGLEVDFTVHGLLEYGEDNKDRTGIENINGFLQSVKKSINNEIFDNENFYNQVIFFLGLIKDGRLIIRKTREPNHAKLYIFKMKDENSSLLKACFITGSSNLTKAGLSGQNEFNVEIKDYGVENSEEYFDSLWDSSDKITEVADFKLKLIDIIEKQTLIADVTPFEAYALILKNYVETIKTKSLKQSTIDILERKDYKPYKYQLDAVSQALTIIDNYNGVIISDVVGLGKSIVASLIAKNLGKRGIIISPPGLIGDDNKKSGWKKYKEDFELHDWEIRSCGLETLKKTNELIRENEEFEVVIIDEVHRFRNQDTEAYELLKSICNDKIVILLTATPFNNSPADIFSLLKLFIVPGRSKITLDNDLDEKFKIYNKAFYVLSYIKKNYKSADIRKRNKAISLYETYFGSTVVNINKVQEREKEISANIRSVIEPVVIRRNRIDLRMDAEYSKEIYDLPSIQDPQEILYELTDSQSNFYDRVISDYFNEEGQFKGAIYRPYLYESENSDDDIDGSSESFQYESQKNLYDFMRRLLVKRFESSFGAFEKSIINFKNINIKVRDFISKSGKYILDRKLIEKIYESDPDEIDAALNEYAESLEDKGPLSNLKVYDINLFYYKNQFLNDIESDIQLFRAIEKELADLKLVKDDPKLKKLKATISEILKSKKNNNEPTRKIIVFTEYTDTAEYFHHHLVDEFNERVLSAYGNLSERKVDEILKNFDASYNVKDDNYDILIGTDKLSEGFNLNRAGVIINIDIPWNPTRVIQRVGRINRIGKTVFRELYIYNSFPTLQGSDIVKSREIAANKMFLIHNTLGEDSKIFDVDEEPTPSALFKRIMENPDELEAESIHTIARNRFFDLKNKHPEVFERIKDLPPRIKVSKKYEKNILTVFFRKGLGFFIRTKDYEENEIIDRNFEEVLSLIECELKEEKHELSNSFWDHYESIKFLKQKKGSRTASHSIEQKAKNNLLTLLSNIPPGLDICIPFIKNLIEDIEEYKTLPDYTLRRISVLKTTSRNSKDIERIAKELNSLQRELGADYLKRIKDRAGRISSEIIIAVENKVI